MNFEFQPCCSVCCLVPENSKMYGNEDNLITISSDEDSDISICAKRKKYKSELVNGPMKSFLSEEVKQPQGNSKADAKEEIFMPKIVRIESEANNFFNGNHIQSSLELCTDIEVLHETRMIKELNRHCKPIPNSQTVRDCRIKSVENNYRSTDDNDDDVIIERHEKLNNNPNVVQKITTNSTTKSSVLKDMLQLDSSTKPRKRIKLLVPRESSETNSRVFSNEIETQDNERESAIFQNIASKTTNNNGFDDVQVLHSTTENGPSTSTADTKVISDAFNRFMDKVLMMETKESDRAKLIKKIKKYYHLSDPKYIKSPEFNEIIEGSMKRLAQDPCSLYYVVKEVLDDLASKRLIVNSEKRKSETSKDDEIVFFEAHEKNQKIVKKLTKTLKKLNKRIKELEEVEVDLSNEEDSSYFKMQKYRERFCQVYKKLCEYTNQVADAKRITKRKIHFCGTKNLAVNECVEKWLNKTKQFPDYADVNKFVEENNSTFNLSREELKGLAMQIFTEVGNMLQRRRKYDLWDSYCSYLDGQEDPAAKDFKLMEVLQQNSAVGFKKEMELINYYAEKQMKDRLEPTEVPDEEANHSPVESDDEDEKEIEEVESHLVERLDSAIVKMEPEESKQDMNSSLQDTKGAIHESRRKNSGADDTSEITRTTGKKPGKCKEDGVRPKKVHYVNFAFINSTFNHTLGLFRVMPKKGRFLSQPLSDITNEGWKSQLQDKDRGKMRFFKFRKFERLTLKNLTRVHFSCANRNEMNEADKKTGKEMSVSGGEEAGLSGGGDGEEGRSVQRGGGDGRDNNENNGKKKCTGKVVEMDEEDEDRDEEADDDMEIIFEANGVTPSVKVETERSVKRRHFETAKKSVKRTDEEIVSNFLKNSPSSISIRTPKKVNPAQNQQSQEMVEALATLRKLKNISATVVRGPGTSRVQEDEEVTVIEESPRKRVKPDEFVIPKIVTVRGNVSEFENMSSDSINNLNNQDPPELVSLICTNRPEPRSYNRSQKKVKEYVEYIILD